MTESSFRQLLLRFAFVPIVSLCGFLVILGLQLREVAMRRLEGAQATTVLLQAYRLQNDVIDEETGVRGYLAAKDPAFLQPYHEASIRLNDELASLQSAAAYDPALTPKISAITENLNRLEALNLLLLKSDTPPYSDALMLEQKQTMDALRIDFNKLISQQDKIRESQRFEITRLLRQLPYFGIGGGILVAGLLIWHGIHLFRELTEAFRKQIKHTEVQRDAFQTTLQSIGDGVLVCDSATNLTLINPTAAQLTGWPPEEAIGRPLDEVFRIIHEYTRLAIESPAATVKRLGAAVGLENRTLLIRRDGTELPIDDSGAPIRAADGSLSGVVLVFRSVAESRRTADLLRQSQERLQSIYNTSLEYIGVLSPEGMLLDCNMASLQFAGNSRDELVGKHFWDCPWFIYTEGMPDFIRASVQRGAAGVPTRTEMTLTRPTGENVQFDFSLTPVVDTEGNVIYLVPEARDISDLKKAQGALMQSEKLAAVGRLASSIAHEINNPLESVTNLLYLARRHSPSPEVDKFLMAADQELRRVSVIANQTLRFHRQASNPLPIEPSELFSTVLSIYEGRLRNSGIKVENGHHTNEPVVCFAGDVRQVLNNLVGNAIDAMKEGGRLFIRSRTSTDWPTGRKGIVLTVGDNGSGISPNDLNRIFEPFFTTKGIGGTGLGLWVSKEVVERHDGSLRVRSSQIIGRSGTVFRLFLPFTNP